MAGEETFHQHEEQRYEEHRQQGGCQGAADDAGADRHAAVGSGAGGDGQRQYPGDKRQRGHDNRAQTSLRGADRRPGERIPLIHGGFSELHDQDGVFRRQADGGQQRHLEVDVVA